MARIIEGPKEKEVNCEDCQSVIGYLPEDVDEKYGLGMDGTSGYRRVKCPRPKCPGYGYIRRW